VVAEIDAYSKKKKTYTGDKRMTCEKMKKQERRRD
jgi:hypothetical protein